MTAPEQPSTEDVADVHRTTTRRLAHALTGDDDPAAAATGVVRGLLAGLVVAVVVAVVVVGVQLVGAR